MKVVPALLTEMARSRAEQGAITAVDRNTITFGELDAASNRMAHALIEKGLKKGDRVVLAFTNPEMATHATCYFGVQKAGGVVVPMNVRLPRPEMEGVLGHCEAKFVLSGTACADLSESCGAKLVPVPALYARAEGLSSEPPDVGLNETDPAELIYTSGTTGLPKGVLAAHANVVGVVNPAFEMLYGGRKFLNPLPIHTFAGTAYLVFCVKAGMHNLVMEKFDPRRFVDLLEKSGATTCYAVAPMWLKVLKEVPDLDQRDFSHVFSLSFGAAAMPPWAVTRLGEIFKNAMIFNIYGLTEAGGAACMLLPGDHHVKPNSVGKPIGDCEVRIIGEDGAGRETGEVGEILMRMPGVRSREYFKDRDSTSQVWDTEGWTHTGDLGYLDADGYLFIVDRKKDIVIQGGNNVSTAEVESALTEHPAIREAAVVGLPHDTLGEMVSAFVVLRPGNRADDGELQTFLKGRLAGYKVPRKFVFVEELPRNPMGKVLKKDLRARYQEFGR